MNDAKVEPGAQTHRVSLRVSKRALHFSFYKVQIKGKDAFLNIFKKFLVLPPPSPRDGHSEGRQICGCCSPLLGYFLNYAENTFF